MTKAPIVFRRIGDLLHLLCRCGRVLVLRAPNGVRVCKCGTAFVVQPGERAN